MARDVRAEVLDLDGDDTPSTSRAEFAYAHLLEAIRRKTLRPGERVREDEISKRLGISRTPVRQALQRLETRGLLQQAPGRGLVVTELDRQRLTELYAVRELLEGAAARLAAQHASASDIAIMRDRLREFRLAAPDADKLARVNRLFHAAVHDAAHNRFLTQSLDDFGDTLALLTGTTFSIKGRWKTELAENVAVVDAIERRDADGAEAAARHNMREAQKLRMLMLFSVPVDE